jgi:hypothetical protein
MLGRSLTWVWSAEARQRISETSRRASAGSICLPKIFDPGS